MLSLGCICKATPFLPVFHKSIRYQRGIRYWELSFGVNWGESCVCLGENAHSRMSYLGAFELSEQITQHKPQNRKMALPLLYTTGDKMGQKTVFSYKYSHQVASGESPSRYCDYEGKEGKTWS